MTVQDYLGTVGLLVAGIGIVLVVYQTFLMVRQNQVIEKQDEILGRRHKLRLLAIARKEADGEFAIDFRCENYGSRGARDFYWHLLVPQKGMRPRMWLGEGGGQLGGDSQILDGLPYLRYRGLYKDPLYPTRYAEIGTIRGAFGAADPTLRVLWQFVAEDGVFPGREAGEMLIALSAPVTNPT